MSQRRDGDAPISHRRSSTPERDAEQESTDSSEDEGEESAPVRAAVWGRPARLLRPVRQLIKMRQLCPQTDLLQRFGGGSGLDDSDDERLERAKQPPAPPGDREDAHTAQYWPPSSWESHEPQTPAPTQPQLARRRGRGAGAGTRPGLSRSSSPRRLGPRRGGGGGGLVHFVDQDRAAAFSTVRDIKITLQRRTLAGEWPSTSRADWRTLASEAEAALRKRRHRYADSLFSKALLKMPPEQGEIRLRLGRAHSLLQLKRYTDAVDDARWVRQKEPENAPAQLLEADALFESGEPERALVRYHCGRRTAPACSRFTAGIRRCEGIIRRLLSADTLRRLREHAECPEMCWQTS